MTTRSLLLNAYVYAVLAFVLVPILIILPMAFSQTDYLAFPPEGFTLHWFTDFFADRRWMKALRFSVEIAALTAVTTSIVGTMACYALMRGAGRLGALFQGLLIGPIVVPHIALAVALYLFFQQAGLSGTVAGYVVAHSVIAMPFVVFTVAAALSAVDPALEDAAMSCGATRFTAFRLVTLPLILPNVLSGALFAFIISFDVFTISFLLKGIGTSTLPIQLFDYLRTNFTPEAAAVSTVSIVLTLAVVIVAEKVLGLRIHRF